MEIFGLSAALFWILVALILGGVEIISLSFFLLWPAIAAVFLSVLTWIFPEMGWATQLVIFAISSMVLLIPGRRWARKAMKDRAEPKINDRAQTLIGREGHIVGGKAGNYRVKIGDTEWSGRGAKSLKSGAQVRVRDVDGIVLEIEAV